MSTLTRRRLFGLAAGAAAAAAVRPLADVLTPPELPAELPPASDFGAVSWDAERCSWFAVGGEGEIQTSQDGVTWTQRGRSPLDDLADLQREVEHALGDLDVTRDGDVISITSREQAIELYGEGSAAARWEGWADKAPPRQQDTASCRVVRGEVESIRIGGRTYRPRSAHISTGPAHDVDQVYAQAIADGILQPHSVEVRPRGGRRFDVSIGVRPAPMRGAVSIGGHVVPFEVTREATAEDIAEALARALRG